MSESLVHVTNFGGPSCKGEVLYDQRTKVFTLRGTCGGKLRYLAAAPPDFRQSYAGSGLPWPNEEVAYGQTPNRGTVKTHEGNFSFNIMYPNAYYVNCGSTLVQPHVHLVVNDSEVMDIKLGGPLVANRSLKNLPGRPRRSAGAGHAST